MGKIIFLCTIFYVGVYADETFSQNEQLQTQCLECHIEEQIPNELIYRRYLMTYSTAEEMENVIFDYMKDPRKENSIMPPPFFFKFSMKEALDLDDVTLRENIRAFLDHYDVKKQLILLQSNDQGVKGNK